MVQPSNQLCLTLKTNNIAIKGQFDTLLQVMKQNFAVSLLMLLILQQGLTLAGTQKQNCFNCPKFKSFLTCDTNSCDWLLLNGYWAGNTSSNTSLLVGGCPLGYCNSNESSKYLWIPADMIDRISDFVCNKTNRMGVLCGECLPGYATAINSDLLDCVPCNGQSVKRNWIFYILSFYVPHFIVFLVIILFNIRLTTGPVNAFILYAQVISTTLNLNAQGGSPISVAYGTHANAFQRSYEVPYDLFNLNLLSHLLPPFCLSESLNTLDVIALKYLEALFPVLMIVLTTLLLRCETLSKIRLSCCSCQKKCRIGTSLEQAFAAFILLAYNRLCEITVYLVTPVRVVDAAIQTVERRVYYKGDFLYNNENYAVRYKLPAYIFLVILILLPITLLHYPLKWIEKYILFKFRCLRNVYPAAKIAILLDTFQGCFKNNRRYFAGLYFALRLLLFVAYYLPVLQELLLQQVLITFYIFLIGFLQPYKNKLLNYLDISIFANMAMINVLEFYLTATNQRETDTTPLRACVIVESVLVFVPLIYLVVYLVWKITRCYHEDIRRKCSNCYQRIPGKSRSSQAKSRLNNEKALFDEICYNTIIERAAEQENDRNDLTSTGNTADTLTH